MTWQLTQITLLTGLATGLFLTLIAAGLSIVFGMQGIINFAHGAFYMLGAYTAVVLQTKFSYALILISAFIVVAVVGAVFDRTLLRNLSGRPHLDFLLTTFGAALVITEIIRMLFGSSAQFLVTPNKLSGVVKLGDISFPRYYFFTIVASLIIILIFYIIFQKTLIGAKIRATVLDGEMARAVGINSHLLNFGVFVVGAGVAGLAGALAGPIMTVYPDMDLDIIILVFAVVIFGGLGSIVGTLVGGVTVGMIQSFANLYWNSTTGQLLVFALMAITVIVRPSGLMGKHID